METIDSYFRYCAEISKKSQITEYNEHVLHIKNVFKDPYRMLKFQSLISKWESCHNAKPGIMSLKLPYWTGEVIAKDMIPDLPQHDEYLNESEFYYFYYNNTGLDSTTDDLRSNNCTLPHTDPGSDRSIPNMIGLINLNQRDVSTGFWEFDGCLTEDTDEIADEYNDYCNDINEHNFEEKTNSTLKKLFDVSYGFNEAIFYDSKAFHQPNIDKYYTRENPRIMMRLSYVLDEEEDECYDD
jgi:hypothetical protein